MDIEAEITNILNKVKNDKLSVVDGVDAILRMPTKFGDALKDVFQVDGYFISKGRQFGTAISIVVNKNNIRTIMPLNDFNKLVRDNIGSIIFTFSNKRFKQKFDDAVALVIKDMDGAVTPHAGKVPVGG